MNKLTKKFKKTESCIDIMAERIVSLTTHTFGRKLNFLEFNNLIKRKLRKAYWIGFATGINNYERLIKTNKKKNKALEDINKFLETLEIEDVRLIKEQLKGMDKLKVKKVEE